MKSPVLTSFAVSLLLTSFGSGYFVATARNVDEKPFIIFFGLLAFPFLWFIAWIVLKGLAWGREMTQGEPPEEPPRRQSRPKVTAEILGSVSV